MNQIRKTHLNMIRKLAWSFHKSTGIDWDELYAEGCYQYCRIREDGGYDPKKSTAKFTTYLWKAIEMGLISFTKKEIKNKYVNIDDIKIHPSSIPNYFFETLDSLSSDCKEMAEMVLKDPYLYLSVPQRMSRSLVIMNLIKREWSWYRIWATLKKIKNELT